MAGGDFLTGLAGLINSGRLAQMSTGQPQLGPIQEGQGAPLYTPPPPSQGNIQGAQNLLRSIFFGGGGQQQAGGIAPFMWGGGQMRHPGTQQQMGPVASPLQGLGQLGTSFSNNMRSNPRNYFPSAGGGAPTYNPFARFGGGSSQGGGLF